jgi:hypothetical protein
MMLLLGDVVPALLPLLRTWHHGNLPVQLDEVLHLQPAEESRRLEVAEVQGLQPYNRRTPP